MPDKNDERMDNAFRILISSDLKVEIQDMYKGLGVNMSEDTRTYWLGKLAQYELGKR